MTEYGVVTLKISLFLPSLRGGGAERVMVNLAREFAEQGLEVDLVLARVEGPYLSQVAPGVRVVDLHASRVLASLPGLACYLRRERPHVLFSALDHANIVAVMARRLAGVPTRVVVSIHNIASVASRTSTHLRARFLPYLASKFYPGADAIVAVSRGVAEDLVRISGIPLECIKVIYNPIVTMELVTRAQEPVEHPWFAPGELPVILGVGRLTKLKDFPTLIQAFAQVRADHPARLMILGEGEDRHKLETLIQQLGLEREVALPGFADNPYAYMARSAVFVLSSACEGLGNVLIEAMACGCPVVSTDCPSGPAEILENGKYGPLIPVGDVEQMARTIQMVLDSPADREGLRVRAAAFSLKSSCEQYLRLLAGSEP